MSTQKQRIVFMPQVTPDDVQDLAWELNWNALEVGDSKEESPVDVWATSDERTEIRFVDDRPIGMRYLLVSGLDRESTCTEVRDTCPTWNSPAAIDFARRSSERNDALVGVYAVALSTPYEDRAPAVAQLESMAASPDPAVRQAVVIATGYVGWQELIPVIQEIQHSDPVEHVRTNAAILLEGLRRSGAS